MSSKLGDITIKGERKVQMVELDLDMDDQTIDRLAHAGFNMIKYDRDELATYAFRKALEAYVNGDKKCRMQLKHKAKRK